MPLLLPFAVLAVPLVDLLLAVVRRTRAGRSPFAPDKQHLHHRLLEIGHTRSGGPRLIMYIWSATIAFAVLAYSLLSGPWFVLVLAALIAVAVAVAVNLPSLRLRGHPAPAAVRPLEETMSTPVEREPR